MEKDWLSVLKPGDEVLVQGMRWQGNVGVVKRVEKVTKLHIVLQDGSKYRLLDGWNIGRDRFYRSYLVNATPENVEKVRAENRRMSIAAKLRAIDWRLLPLEALEEVFNVATQHKEENSSKSENNS